MTNWLNIFQVWAIENPVIPDWSDGDPSRSVSMIISVILGYLFIGGVIIAFGYLAFGAIEWLTAGSDKNKLMSGRQKVVQALIGLILLLSLLGGAMLVGRLLGINLFSFEIPPIAGMDCEEVCLAHGCQNGNCQLGNLPCSSGLIYGARDCNPDTNQICCCTNCE